MFNLYFINLIVYVYVLYMFIYAYIILYVCVYACVPVDRLTLKNFMNI